jgi:hypothetical protein
MNAWRGIRFCLLHDVQIGSGAHPATYPMYGDSFFPGTKLAGE